MKETCRVCNDRKDYSEVYRYEERTRAPGNHDSSTSFTFTMCYDCMEEELDR